MQLGTRSPSALPTSPSPTSPPLATSIVLPNLICILGRANDDGGGHEAYQAAPCVIVGDTCVLLARLDDGELAIMMSSLSSSVACAGSSNTLGQLHSVAAFTISAEAYTPVTTTSSDRVQVRLSTHCISPPAVRTPAVDCPAVDATQLTRHAASCALLPRTGDAPWRVYAASDATLIARALPAAGALHAAAGHLHRAAQAHRRPRPRDRRRRWGRAEQWRCPAAAWSAPAAGRARTMRVASAAA